MWIVILPFCLSHSAQFLVPVIVEYQLSLLSVNLLSLSNSRITILKRGPDIISEVIMPAEKYQQHHNEIGYIIKITFVKSKTVQEGLKYQRDIQKTSNRTINRLSGLIYIYIYIDIIKYHPLLQCEADLLVHFSYSQKRLTLWLMSDILGYQCVENSILYTYQARHSQWCKQNNIENA